MDTRLLLRHSGADRNVFSPLFFDNILNRKKIEGKKMQFHFISTSTNHHPRVCKNCSTTTIIHKEIKALLLIQPGGGNLLGGCLCTSAVSSRTVGIAAYLCSGGI